MGERATSAAQKIDLSHGIDETFDPTELTELMATTPLVLPQEEQAMDEHLANTLGILNEALETYQKGYFATRTHPTGLNPKKIPKPLGSL